MPQVTNYEQPIKQAVRSVVFGFKENLIVYAPAGCGKSTVTMEEIRRHDTPCMQINCSVFTDDDFWEFKRLLRENEDKVWVLDEANCLPPRLAELIHMYIRVYDHKGVIALAQSRRDGSYRHLCLSEAIDNALVLN